MEIEFQRKINEEFLTVKISLFKYLYMDCGGNQNQNGYISKNDEIFTSVFTRDTGLQFYSFVVF